MAAAQKQAVMQAPRRTLLIQDLLTHVFMGLQALLFLGIA
jgi:hypothetical protein